ncbi:MAG: ester cyclase, partial [Planctomycetota bacterium]
MYSQIRNISIACIISVAVGGFFQTATANPEANKTVVERRVELWNTGDLAVADEIFATDFVSHVPHYPDVSDLESYKAEVINTRTAFPDFHAEVHDMIAEGDKVACRFTNRYTGPTGKQVTATGITIDHFVDGKIVEEWWSVDTMGVMEQFGMMPATREDYTWGTPSEVIGDPGDPETNKAIVQRMIDEVMNQQNMGVVDELFAADYLMHDPAWPMEVKGTEGFKQWAGAMLEPYFSDSHIAAADIIGEGDKVVVRWTWTGTHTGEFMGI